MWSYSLCIGLKLGFENRIIANMQSRWGTWVWIFGKNTQKHINKQTVKLTYRGDGPYMGIPPNNGQPSIPEGQTILYNMCMFFGSK